MTSDLEARVRALENVVLELLALRDGADAKDAQIGRCERKAVFCKSESAVVSAVFSLLHEIMPDWTHTHCGESSDVKAVAAIRALVIECDAKDVQIAALLETCKEHHTKIERLAEMYTNEIGKTLTLKQHAEARCVEYLAEIVAVRQELATLTAKASTPTWWVNCYPTHGYAHRSEHAARVSAGACDPMRTAVPVYEHPPEAREVLGYGCEIGSNRWTWTSNETASLDTCLKFARQRADTRPVYEILRGDALGET